MPLPGDTFDRALTAHLEVVERRVRRLYVRPRALFAEAVVAALIDGAVVEFPAAAWDVELTLSSGRQPVRIQVKCSGEERRSHRRRSGPRIGEGLRPPSRRKILCLAPSVPGSPAMSSSSRVMRVET